MTLSKALETYTILMMFLRSYTPLLAIICSNKDKELRVEAMMMLATEVAKSDDDLLHVTKAIENIVGGKVDMNLPPSELIELIKKSWQVNSVQEFLIALMQFKIIDEKDIANYNWIVVNWRLPNGTTRNTG